MSFGDYARRAAYIAHELTYVSRKRTVDGQDVYILPADQAERLKTDALEICDLLNDLQDERDKSGAGGYTYTPK